MAEAQRLTFDPNDAEYLKNCLMLHAIVNLKFREGVTPLENAVRLFDWLDRNVQSVPKGAVPEGAPFEVCVRGLGAETERSWIFLELLRQANVPGCIIATAGADPATIGDHTRDQIARYSSDAAAADLPWASTSHE